MSLLDKWNKKRFSVFESEEKTVLEIVESINNFNKDIVEEVDNKTDKNGNHLGSWQGLNKPTLSDEGMRATVEKLSDETLPTIGNILLNKEYDIKNLPSPLESAKGDGITDDTITIQSAIDYITSLGGGKLYLPKGTYLITNTIYLKPNVRLVGESDVNTIIKVKESANIDAINMGWSQGSEVSNLFISFPTKPVIANSSINAPFNTMGNGLVVGTDDRSQYVSLSTNKVHHLKIIGAPENGILIHPGVWVIDFNNFHIRECGLSGIRNNSTDNTFSDIYVFNCLHGIFATGSNNKYYKAKLIFSGMAYAKLNSNIYDHSAGFRAEGVRRSVLDGVECQDNSGHGFIFVNCGENLLNCISDGNGRHSVDNGVAKQGIGFVFWGTCNNFSGTISATNYATDTPQIIGIHISANSQMFNFNYTRSQQVNAEDELLGTKINLNSSMLWNDIKTTNSAITGTIKQGSNNNIFKVDLSITLSTSLSANTIATITSNITGLRTGTRCQVPCIFETADGSSILGQGILIIDGKGFRVISPTTITSGSIIKACN